MNATILHLRKRAGVPLLEIAFAAVAVAAAVSLLAGCDSQPDSHVVSAPPPAVPVAVSAPVVATTQSNTVTTTQAPAAIAVVVTQAPPATLTETVSAQPSPAYFWVAGYWTWNSNEYLWVAGHWQIPPHASSVWVPPHWEPEGGAFRFFEGYWS